MRIRDILQRREAIRQELRGIVEKHGDGGALPADVLERSTALEAEAEALNAAERRQVIIDDLDRRAVGTPLTGDGSGGGDANFEKLAAGVSVLDAIRAQTPWGTDRAAGVAKEVSAELAKRSGRPAQGLYYSMALSGRTPEKRVFSTTTPAGGPGGALVETSVSPTMIDALRAAIVVRQLGATVLSGLTGNLAVPRLKTDALTYWVGENVAVTASDPATDQIVLTPKHTGGLCEITRQMLQQAVSPDVNQMVENMLARLIALSIDRAAIVGGGTSEPNGLLATASAIPTLPLGATGGPPTWDSIVGLIASVDVANALQGSLAFLTNGKAVSKMRRTLKTSADTSSNFLMTDAASLAGYPLASTQLVPSNLVKSTSGAVLSALIFGNFADLYIGFWSELDLLANYTSDAVFAKGNVQLRAMATCDVQIAHAASFCALVDVATV